MKSSFRCGVALGVSVVCALVACTSSDVGFSSPGNAGSAGNAGNAGEAVDGEAGSSAAGHSAGAHAVAGASGAEPGNGGEAGSEAGDAGMLNVAGHSGAAHGGAGGSAGQGVSGGGASGAGTSGGGTGGAPITVGCGNGVREASEQCDDGNNANLDACDSSCQFEQSQRVNGLKLAFTPTAYCPANAFGSAYSAAVQTALQDGIAARITNGSLSLLFAFSGLGDPTGATSDASVSIGWIIGDSQPIANYDGTNGFDWWHVAPAASINASRVPVLQLSATNVNGVFSATSRKVPLPLLSSTPLDLTSVKLKLGVGDSTKPLASSNGMVPGHLANEHLDPALVSFATAGQQAGAGAGEMCGNLSAASLKTEPLPADYLENGSTPCSPKYKAGATYLDVLVGGCTLGFGQMAFTVVSPTQPDTIDPAATQTGSGPPYKLTMSDHAVTGCKDNGGNDVSVPTCLTAAAYSSAYKLTTNRVIIK